MKNFKNDMNQTENKILLSQHLACRLCRYDLSDKCPPCIAGGQYESFEPKGRLSLEDLPRFPLSDFNNGMPVKMRQVVIGIYMDSIVRLLQEGR